MPSLPTFASRAAASLGLAAALLCASATGSFAQAVRTGSAVPPDPSRVDLYEGYGYIHPVNSDINNFEYQPINPGAVVSITGYFNRYLGVQAEGSFFPHGPNDCIYTAQAGPILRYQRGRLVPWAHVLGGAARVGGPAFQPCTWGWGLTGGVGVDYILPFLNNHLAIRPIQADFDYSHVDYGPLVPPGGVSGGLGQIHAYRLSAGILLRFGNAEGGPPVQLGCTVQPADVYPGDPVTVTAVPANLHPHKNASYTWSISGGTIAGSDTTATVATNGLSAGDYTVSGHVSEGPRHSQQANCTPGFRVHDYEPPTLSCSANPSTVLPGESSTITTAGRSPQNRPLTYAYSTTSGQITGSGPSVTLTTSSASTGTIEITCTAVDDLGKQAAANTSVIISIPPPAPVPQPRNLCSVSFDRDFKRPVRVDNEGKACLDDIALTLLRDPQAKLVIVGHHDANEKPEASAERALNIEQYLIDEKAIDAARIELRTGEATGRSADDTLVPAGATFNSGSTATFDANTIQRHGTAYGKTKAAGTKIR